MGIIKDTSSTVASIADLIASIQPQLNQIVTNTGGGGGGGGATEAKQDDQITIANGTNTKLDDVNLQLSGLSKEIKQDQEIAHLDSIDTGIGAVNTKLNDVNSSLFDLVGKDYATSSNQGIQNNNLVSILQALNGVSVTSNLKNGTGDAITSLQSITTNQSTELSRLLSILQSLDGTSTTSNLKNGTGNAISALQAISALLSGASNGVLKNVSGDAITALQLIASILGAVNTNVFSGDNIANQYIRTLNKHSDKAISGTFSGMTPVDIDTQGYKDFSIFIRNATIVNQSFNFQGGNDGSSFAPMGLIGSSNPNGSYITSLAVNAGVLVNLERPVCANRYIRITQTVALLADCNYSVYMRT